MTIFGRVLAVYTAFLMTALAVSMATFGVKPTLIAFGVIEVASVLLITILSYGEPDLFSGLEKAKKASSSGSEQLALLHDLMKQSPGSRPTLAFIATLPRRS